MTDAGHIEFLVVKRAVQVAKRMTDRRWVKGKGKILYGQEPPSGDSTTTECGFNYQLLAVIY